MPMWLRRDCGQRGDLGRADDYAVLGAVVGAVAAIGEEESWKSTRFMNLRLAYIEVREFINTCEKYILCTECKYHRERPSMIYIMPGKNT